MCFLLQRDFLYCIKRPTIYPSEGRKYKIFFLRRKPWLRFLININLTCHLLLTSSGTKSFLRLQSFEAQWHNPPQKILTNRSKFSQLKVSVGLRPSFERFAFLGPKIFSCSTKITEKTFFKLKFEVLCIL